MELRKHTTRTPTRLICAEGNMNRGDSASPYSVRRSRRPQTRLETSCTRTGRPRECLRRKLAAGRREKASSLALWRLYLDHGQTGSNPQRESKAAVEESG
jgi:ribosomal protein S14